MGFLFPKAPKPIPPANPAIPAPTTNAFSQPAPSAGSFIGAAGAANYKRKAGTEKTSLIGG